MANVNGNSSIQLSSSSNHCVICDSKDAQEGKVIFGGNGRGLESNEFD